MGNCIRKGSSAEWGGDDWGSFGSGQEKVSKEEEGGSGSGRDDSICLGAEVKIKVSRKELENVLKEADVQGLSLHQLLAQLVNAADVDPHQRSWTPNLQSIPESE